MPNYKFAGQNDAIDPNRTIPLTDFALRRLRWNRDIFSPGRDHECHFPDRGWDFHFDWNALTGRAIWATRSRCEV
jgi:hypothetical protein